MVNVITLLFLILTLPWASSAALVQHKFTIGSQNVSRLCRQQQILSVNGQFPGPTIYVHEGDNLLVQVYNDGPYDISIHWHGIRQLRSCWADGPAYITQCPIIPGKTFMYNFSITEQEGTLWWHAHILYHRATVHGAIVIYPRIGNAYPFPKPHAEFPIILGEWWNSNVNDVIGEAIRKGAIPNESDAYTINSQPGDLFPCSAKDTVKILVKRGKTYLLRMVNAAMNYPFFFSIAGHKMTVVAVDACYTKQKKTDVVLIYPGQTADILVTAHRARGLFYMTAQVYNSAPARHFNNISTTAILKYRGSSRSNSVPLMPTLPAFNNTPTAYNLSTQLRSMSSSVPQCVDEEMLITQGYGLVSCPNNSCSLLNGKRGVGSFNNISFVEPHTAILQAYYFGIDGVFTRDFPDNPPLKFNYTGQNLPLSLFDAELGTKLKVLKFNSSVQIVFQGTSILSLESHPIHIHGYDFYVVGNGFGNYNPETDPLNFNLEDPQKLNTLGIPTGGWAAIRFRADNPGIWLVHCHYEAHSALGFNMVFLVENGPGELDGLPPPPPDLPQCYIPPLIKSPW